MKKILLSTALLGATLLAQADGTVSYGDWKFNYEGTNSAATLVSVEQQGGTTLDMTSNAEGVIVTTMRSTIFDNCTTLADLTLPSTLSGFVEDPTLFKGEFIGETGAATDNNPGKHLNCGQFDANPNISIELYVKSGTAAENSYNQWGNTLFTFGSKALPDPKDLKGTTQIYYTVDGTLRVVTYMNDSYASTTNSKAAVAIPFTVNFDCSNGNFTVSATDSEGKAIEFGNSETTLTFNDYTINGFSQFSYAMGTGMDADVEIINNSPRHETPQFARTAISSIKVAEGNTAIKAEGNGTLLYTADNALIYRPLTDCGSIFTIADNTNRYFYTAIERTMAGQLGTGDGNNRRVQAGELSSAIAPGTLFALASTPQGGGFKITCLNSDRQMEFGGKAGNHDYLDVCVSQWSQPYLTTFLGENTYVLSTRDTNHSLFAGPNGNVRLAQNVNINDENYHLTIKAAEGIELTFGDDGYMATTLPVAVTIPAGAKVFEVIGEHNGEAALYALEGNINAGTPFLAYCSESTQLTFPIAEAATTGSRAAGYPNLLHGYPTRVTGLTADSYFVLNPSSKQFEKSDATQTALGVPYILASDLPDFTGSALALPESEPTSITEIEGANNISNAIYDLQGRRLTSPRHGLNIINGRKVLTR